MPVEVASYVGQLVPSNPANSDPVQQGADHLRLLKSTLVASFPNITGAMTVSHTDLNDLPGRATALEANRARKDIADTFAAKMTFTTGLDAASIERGGAEIEPIGSISMTLEATAKPGYLLLNGQAVSRTTYAALFAKGAPYVAGPGDGSTTFNLPDFTLRFPIHKGTGPNSLGSIGGSTTLNGGTDTAPAHIHNGHNAGGHSHGGATGGTVLTVGQLPSHGHGVIDPGHTHGWSGLNGNVLLGSGGSGLSPLGATAGTGGVQNSYGFWLTHEVTGISIQNTGNNEAHTHVIFGDGVHAHGMDAAGAHAHTVTVAGYPPFFVVNFVVRAL